MSEPVATVQAPIYQKVCLNKRAPTKLFMIICDEGWRESIVCSAMYEWTADWLLDVLGNRPYAPEHRPRIPALAEEEPGA